MKISASHFRNFTGSAFYINSSTMIFAVSGIDFVDTNGASQAININYAIGTISNIDVQNCSIGVDLFNTHVTMTGSVVANGQQGIVAVSGTVLQLGGTVVTQNNQKGVNIIGATIYSYGDNDINANNPDVTGTMTVTPKQ